mgnify:CR=1 FL=1
MEVYIGIDLAWGEKNLSGFCVLTPLENTLKILEIKLLHTLDEITDEIKKYLAHQIYVGVDAPLLIPNESGNREIEKAFNKDFSKYKISMLPVNRKLLTKFSPKIRSEVLYEKLSSLGFSRDLKAKKALFEVYPHATIALCFNDNKILPYKRKKGRDTLFIKEQLKIYQNYLQSVCEPDSIFEEDIDLLKGKSLKDYEDKLDSFTSAYTLLYCKNKPHKIYKLDNIDTFITPIEES